MTQTPAHFDHRIPARDRRAGVRQAVRSLAYVQLEDGNGGIALNVSEGGIALQAIVSLSAVDLPSMRIQLAHSRKQIEAKGRVAWTNGFRRLAGVEFVDLSEESRIQIREWISLESSDLRPVPALATQGGENTQISLGLQHAGTTLDISASSRSQEPNATLAPARAVPSSSETPTLQRRARTPVLPAAAVPPAFVPDPYRLVAPGAAPQPRAAATTPKGAAAASYAATESSADRNIALDSPISAVARPAVMSSALIRSEEAGGPTELAADEPELRRRRNSNTVGIVLWVSFFTAVSLAAGWFAGRGGLPEIIQRITREAPVDTRGAEPKAEPAAPAADTSQIEIVDLNHRHWLIPMQASGQTAATAFSNPDSQGNVARWSGNDIPDPALSTPLQQRFAPERSAAIAPEVTSPPVGPNSLSPVSGLGFGGAISVPAPVPPGSVPRVTSGNGLRLGELIYKVDPAYPPKALAEKIEGVVKILAVIGADGNVKAVRPLSGPALLVPTAIDAIRQWRYSPSLLDGQPIENQREISVNFQIARKP